MLGGEGPYRGSSILVSGTAGTGKSSIAACFVEAACRRGEKALYFAFEESPEQIMRNMRSIGVDLSKWVDGRSAPHPRRAARRTPASRCTSCRMNREVEEFSPAVTVIDPITNLTSIGTHSSIRATLTRLIDAMKSREITALFTSLTEGGEQPREAPTSASRR